MQFMIGFWLLCLAITILFVWLLDNTSTTKEKIKFVCGFMTFMTLVFAAAWFMSGSEV